MDLSFFFDEFQVDAGPGGPLSDYGLVPDPKLADVQAAVAAGTVLAMP